MSLKKVEEQNENEYTITEEREDNMIPTSFDGNPTLRSAHFLKPLLNPKIQSLPKTPFVSLSSNPNIINDVAKYVCFKGTKNLLRSWKSWVDELAKTHEIIWKKVGIFDAIKCSTCKIRRDNHLIMCLAEKWCAETNTFVFSWGECTLTLEDVMILGGFSVMGDSVFTLTQSKKFAEIKDELDKSCCTISRNCSYNLSVYGWFDYYKGKGGDIEHVALIVLWLSRYVFIQKSSSRINKDVFDIAISLAMGNKLALAPAVLASIYRDLTLLKERIACQNTESVVDGSNLVLRAPFHLVQLWAWERFLALRPKPNCLVAGEPRGARWHNVRKLKNTSVRSDIDESHADSFVWRPYALSLQNWDIPKFYSDDGKWVVIDSEVDEELLPFARCLRTSELVGLDCVMQYLPHRVGMQFGMDQDIPNFVPMSKADYKVAWSNYDKPLEGLKLYIPPRLFEGDVTTQYAAWWRQVSSAPGIDELQACPRRKRSARKRKSSYQLLRGMKSPKQQCKVDEFASSTALDEQENTSMCDAYTIPLKDNRHMANEHLKGNYHAQADTESMNVDAFGSGIDVLDDKSSFFNLSVEPQIVENEATEIGTKMNVILGKNVEDGQHDVEECDCTPDIVVISDDEDDRDCNPLEELFKDIQARINNRLHKIDSALEALKTRGHEFCTDVDV